MKIGSVVKNACGTHQQTDTLSKIGIRLVFVFYIILSQSLIIKFTYQFPFQINYFKISKNQYYCVLGVTLHDNIINSHHC